MKLIVCIYSYLISLNYEDWFAEVLLYFATSHSQSETIKYTREWIKIANYGWIKNKEISKNFWGLKKYFISNHKIWIVNKMKKNILLWRKSMLRWKNGKWKIHERPNLALIFFIELCCYSEKIDLIWTSIFKCISGWYIIHMHKNYGMVGVSGLGEQQGIKLFNDLGTT